MEVGQCDFSLFLKVDFIFSRLRIGAVSQKAITGLFFPDRILRTVGKLSNTFNIGIILNTNKNTVLLGGLYIT